MAINASCGVTVDDLVRREVYYCVSALISTLAAGVQAVSTNTDMGHNLYDHCEAAQELSWPIEDWEEAARQEGWDVTNDNEFTDGTEIVGSIGPDDPDGGWPTLCDAMGIEPYQREIFEHWIVSDWLADKLAEHGEKVDKDFAGMTIWARTTTGQGIAQDAVIENIVKELNGADLPQN